MVLAMEHQKGEVSMEQNVLLANIIGLAIAVPGVLLYAWSIYEGKFGSWKTFVGFAIAAIGCIYTLIASGALS